VKPLVRPFRDWELVPRDKLLRWLCGPEAVTTHFGGRWDDVEDQRQQRRRQAVLQKAREIGIVRYRPSYRKWQIMPNKELATKEAARG